MNSSPAFEMGNFERDNGHCSTSMKKKCPSKDSSIDSCLDDNESHNKMKLKNHSSLQSIKTRSSSSKSLTKCRSFTTTNSRLRKTTSEKSLQNKKRIIKMLTVVVLEFFICWSPLYIVNTLYMYFPSFLYRNLGGGAISGIQLLAYSSSCCNPITYCFMNANFRKAFLSTISCFICKKTNSRYNTGIFGQ